MKSLSCFSHKDMSILCIQSYWHKWNACLHETDDRNSSWTNTIIFLLNYCQLRVIRLMPSSSNHHFVFREVFFKLRHVLCVSCTLHRSVCAWLFFFTFLLVFSLSLPYPARLPSFMYALSQHSPLYCSFRSCNLYIKIQWHSTYDFLPCW